MEKVKGKPCKPPVGLYAPLEKSMSKRRADEKELKGKSKRHTTGVPFTVPRKPERKVQDATPVKLVKGR